MTDLTARSEDIERAELIDLHAGPPAALRDRLGLRLEEALWSRSRPRSRAS